jgi:hypothetical protein
MNIKTSLFATLLGFSLPVAAEFTTVSLAHEVSLSNFRVPVTLNSGVAFMTCDDCDIQRSRVTAETQYIINGQPVPLKEFRKSVFKIRNRADELVIVLQHLESNTIVSVSVTI